MINLKELTLDQTCEIVPQLMEYIENMLSDKEMIGEFEKFATVDKENSLINLANVSSSLSKLICIALKNHKNDVFGILSIMFEMPIEEVGKLNLLKIVPMVKDVIGEINFLLSSI